MVGVAEVIRDDLDSHREGWFEVAQAKIIWKDLGETFAQ